MIVINTGLQNWKNIFWGALGNFYRLMKKLKLASQRKLLSGTSIPLSLRRAGFTPKRIANDSTPVNDNDDNVGLIDGFLKLMAPDAFKTYSEHKKRMYERYDYE